MKKLTKRFLAEVLDHHRPDALYRLKHHQGTLNHLTKKQRKTLRREVRELLSYADLP